MPDSSEPTAPRPGAAAEPDLATILRLLDPATFAPGPTWKRAHPPWAAQRDVAVVALCWIVGLRPLQIERLRRSDWRPGGDVLSVSATPKYEGVRNRDLPVLAAARDAVGAYLKACPLPLPATGPLILRADGSGFAERDVSPLNARIKKATVGRIGSLAELAGRFFRYVEATHAVDGSVEWLVGRTGVYDHFEPGMKRLRRLLETSHPVGRGLPRTLD